MKQFCLVCDEVFYPTNKNYIGYPYLWKRERGIKIDCSHDRVFCTKNCMDIFLATHSDFLIPIFKQIKERENNHDNRENQT